MKPFSGQNKRLLWGVMIVGIGGILLLAVSDSRSQGIGGTLRQRARVFPPASAVAPTTAPNPALQQQLDLNKGTHLDINFQKRLILSAEGSSNTSPVLANRNGVGQTSDGEIWLTVSYDDGSPFTMAKVDDVHIEVLDRPYEGALMRLDRALSRPADGLWHFILPQLTPGSHFYRVRVESNIAAWKTNFEGQTIVRASYVRMPYWNAQRSDGTIWEPPH